MRASRSATRSSMGSAAFLYFGVSSAGAALVDFSWTAEGLVDFFCAVDKMGQSRVRQRIKRSRISIFFMGGGTSPLGTDNATPRYGEVSVRVPLWNGVRGQ